MPRRRNPLEGPDLSRTHDRVLVRRGYSYERRRTVVVRDGYSYKRGRRRVKVPPIKKTIVLGIVEVPAVWKWVPKKKFEGRWRSAWEYTNEYKEEYEIRQPDMIYRFHPASDVIEMTEKFVWDKPLPKKLGGGFVFPSNVAGFRGIRAWILVEYEGGDSDYQIWARSMILPPLVHSWEQVLEHLEELKDAFVEETENGLYSMKEFLAFTVYVKVKDSTGRITDKWSERPGQAGLEKMPTKKPRKRKRAKGHQ